MLPSDNPLHPEWHRDQLVLDPHSGLRPRAVDEQTVGTGATQTKYVLCAPIMVRAVHKQCRWPYPRSRWLSRSQVSLRSSAKPGRKGVNLRKSDFKTTHKTYLVTSRESPTMYWIEVLNPSDPAILEYVDRDKTEYEGQKYLDHGDCFDTFCEEFDIKESRALLETREQLPLVLGNVGRCFPRTIDLVDTIKSAQGAPSHTLCSRARRVGRGPDAGDRCVFARATFIFPYRPCCPTPHPRRHSPLACVSQE